MAKNVTKAQRADAMARLGIKRPLTSKQARQVAEIYGPLNGGKNRQLSKAEARKLAKIFPGVAPSLTEVDKGTGMVIYVPPGWFAKAARFVLEESGVLD